MKKLKIRMKEGGNRPDVGHWFAGDVLVSPPGPRRALEELRDCGMGEEITPAAPPAQGNKMTKEVKDHGGK